MKRVLDTVEATVSLIAMYMLVIYALVIGLQGEPWWNVMIAIGASLGFRSNVRRIAK